MCVLVYRKQIKSYTNNYVDNTTLALGVKTIPLPTLPIPPAVSFN